MQKETFEGFEFKGVDFSAFIYDRKNDVLIDGGITPTGSVANFNNDWNKDMEELNDLLNEAFKELNGNKSK